MPANSGFAAKGAEHRPRRRRTGHQRSSGRATWGFTGGTIERVIVEVSGEVYADLEKEATTAFQTRLSRQ
jgi:hypothetical protein